MISLAKLLRPIVRNSLFRWYRHLPLMMLLQKLAVISRQRDVHFVSHLGDRGTFILSPTCKNC